MNNYPINGIIRCIDDYKIPEDTLEYIPCNRCNFRPKVWTFDNGRFTACGCYNNIYDHFTIQAESCNSIYQRGGDMTDYFKFDLKHNWNHYQLTGEIVYEFKVKN